MRYVTLLKKFTKAKLTFHVFCKTFVLPIGLLKPTLTILLTYSVFLNTVNSIRITSAQLKVSDKVKQCAAEIYSLNNLKSRIIDFDSLVTVSKEIMQSVFVKFNGSYNGPCFYSFSTFILLL